MSGGAWVQKGRKGSGSHTRKVKHYSRESARAHIEQLKNKGIRGTARLRAYKCTPCSKKEGREVFHVGHDNGKKGGH